MSHWCPRGFRGWGEGDECAPTPIHRSSKRSGSRGCGGQRCDTLGRSWRCLSSQPPVTLSEQGLGLGTSVHEISPSSFCSPISKGHRESRWPGWACPGAGGMPTPSFAKRCGGPSQSWAPLTGQSRCPAGPWCRLTQNGRWDVGPSVPALVEHHNSL